MFGREEWLSSIRQLSHIQCRSSLQWSCYGYSPSSFSSHSRSSNLSFASSKTRNPIRLIEQFESQRTTGTLTLCPLIRSQYCSWEGIMLRCILCRPKLFRFGLEHLDGLLWFWLYEVCTSTSSGWSAASTTALFLLGLACKKSLEGIHMLYHYEHHYHYQLTLFPYKMRTHSGEITVCGLFAMVKPLKLILV